MAVIHVRDKVLKSILNFCHGVSGVYCSSFWLRARVEHGENRIDPVICLSPVLAVVGMSRMTPRTSNLSFVSMS